MAPAPCSAILKGRARQPACRDLGRDCDCRGLDDALASVGAASDDVAVVAQVARARQVAEPQRPRRLGQPAFARRRQNVRSDNGNRRPTESHKRSVLLGERRLNHGRADRNPISPYPAGPARRLRVGHGSWRHRRRGDACLQEDCKRGCRKCGYAVQESLPQKNRDGFAMGLASNRDRNARTTRTMNQTPVSGRMSRPIPTMESRTPIKAMARPIQKVRMA